MRYSPVSLRWSVILVAVILISLLACGVSPTRSTPTAEMPLQTPTPVPQITAILETPQAATPTAMAEATATQAVVAGSPMAAFSPGPAPQFADLPAALAGVLEETGGDADAVRDALTAWGMAELPPTGLIAFAEDPLLASADLTGDGVPEIVVAANNPESAMMMPEGMLMIFGKRGNSYGVQYNSSTQDIPVEGFVSIIQAADANDDAVADLAFGAEWCGAHTCTVNVHVLSYKDDKYADLAPEVSGPYPDFISLQDTNGDGYLEILIHGNIIGSAGAGPQRMSTSVYSLREGQYVLTEMLYDESDLLYFKIVDANLALASGETEKAIALYTRALTDASLVASGMMLNGMNEQQESDALHSFARFRLVVANTLLNKEGEALAVLEEIRQAGGAFAPLAEVFWQALIETGNVDGACEAVTALAEQDPAYLDIMNSFGYANPELSADQLCRGAGTGAFATPTP